MISNSVAKGDSDVLGADTTARASAAAAAPPSLWLGYAPTGGRLSLRLDEIRKRLFVGGHRADELVSLLICAARESGLRTLVLDTDGHLSPRISGYLEPYDYTCFLHDAFEIDEDDSSRHGQLMASAYTTAMGLSAEEEAIVAVALQKLAIEDRIATPAVLFNNLDTVEGFRGFYVDKLKGRIGGLKFLEAAENGSLRSVLSLGGSLIDFSTARYPQAMELTSAVFLAKIMVMLPRAKLKPDIIVVSGAHRVFRALPRVQHTERLLTELLDAPETFVISSDHLQGISKTVSDAFPNKILSSDVWNEGIEGRWKGNTRDPILPNAYVIVDGHFGHQRTFIARIFEAKHAEPRKGPAAVEQKLSGPGKDDELTMVLLEDIKRYEAPTRTSLIEFFSGEYGREAVEAELDRLYAQGCIVLESKEPRKGGGPPMLVYTLTAAGRRALEAMGEP